MTTRYPGGVITKTPVVPAGPYEDGAAPGIWTLDQQLQAQNAGIWPTAGLQPNYIEDVFSTYLYTGDGSTQTITNNIDLSTKGGMVWLKSRSAATNHFLFDTTRGALKEINSNTTDAQASLAASLTAFNTTGFALGAAAGINVNAETYASWTFREQPKFFDIVTYTGTGANRTIAHDLGSVPGMIIVKSTTLSSASSSWAVYHRSMAATAYLSLNSTGAAVTGNTSYWNSAAPTASVFSVGTSLTTNGNGQTYVAYLFAHDAGGFGLTGTDNVISCGTFTTDGSGNATVSLGYEPQWVLWKAYAGTTGTSNWDLFDNMRGYCVAGATSNDARLQPDSPNAEGTYNVGGPNATGFTVANQQADDDYIYIAIRRGPMKVPTSGTSVYQAVARAGTGANATISGIGFTPDLWIDRYRTVGPDTVVTDRLRGISPYLATNLTTAESGFGGSGNISFDMSGVTVGTGAPFNASGNNYINWFFQRAPGFFDEVCYTGTGANTTQTHNLAAVPELMLVKSRSNARDWQIYSSALANTEYLVLNTTAAKATGATRWNSTTPTSSVFSLGTASEVNTSAETYVAYLFATVAGVSKVGSYTGTGTTQTINCGFTAGARFVLIKRTDSTGGWYVWDSERGIVAGNDPYLLLNSTAAEVTGTDYVDTASSGFGISSTAPAAINANGGSFIFLAIA